MLLIPWHLANDLKVLADSIFFFSIKGTYASFDFSKSTHICKGSERRIIYALVSGSYRHEQAFIAHGRFLSSSINLRGCVARCCSLKWCKHALVSQHKCYGTACGERRCLYRRRRRAGVTTRFDHKSASVTTVQSVHKGTI